MSDPSPSHLRDRLRRVAERSLQVSLIRGLLLTLALASLLWLAAATVEAVFWLSPLARLTILITFSLVTIGVGAWLFLYPAVRRIGWFHPPTAEEGAMLIRDRYPSAASQAFTLLDLMDGRGSNAPPHLIQGATAQLSRGVAPTPFENAISRAPIRQGFHLAVAPVLLLVVSLTLFPNPLQEASERLLTPRSIYERPAPFSMSLSPGNVEIPRGESVALNAIITEGEPPQTLSFEIRRDGQVTTREATASDTGFEVTIDDTRTSFEYRAVADGVSSDWYTAEVVPYPVVSELQVDVTPPPYTGASAQTLPEGRGDVMALPESHVQVEIRTVGANVREGYLIFDHGDSLSLAVHPQGLTGSFSLDREGSYKIKLVDEEGRTSRDPVHYELQLVEDLPPQIMLLDPPVTEELAGAQTALLRARIQDDYGFSQLRLYFRRTDDDDFASIPLPISDLHDTDQVIEFPWRLQADTGVRLQSGESLEYYVSVWDNDRPGGFKSARSDTQRLYVPTEVEMAERASDVSRDDSDARTAGDQSLQATTDDPERTARQTDRQHGYDTNMGDVDEEHRDIARQTEELTRNIESTLREMQQPSGGDPESQALLDRMQAMSEELGIENLSEALRQMQQQDPASDDAMQQLRQHDSSMEDRLEQMRSMMEQLKTRQNLQELSEDARSMADQQVEVSASTQEAQESEDVSAADRDELGDMQQSLNEAVERMQERMETAAQDMEDVRGAPREAMQNLRDELDQQDLPSQIDEISEQLRSGDMQAAESSQQEMMQIFRNMEEQFGQMQEQMTSQQEQLNIAAIRQTIRNLLALSEQQEQLLLPARNLSPGSDEQRERTARQFQIREGLSTVSDTLRTLVASVPMLSGHVMQETGAADDAMNRAIESLSGRSPSQATRPQRDALSHLNTLALSLSRLLEEMQDGEGGGGGASMEQMAEQLEQMGGEQQQLNEEMQEMLNQMQGERLSSDQEERLERLAQQQEQLRRAIEQRRVEQDGEGDAGLERLEEAAAELDEVIAELRRDRLTNDHQQNILMRLLETRRSMRDQDERPERRAEIADGTYPRVQDPVALPDRPSQERLFQDVFRLRPGAYAYAYQRLIEQYLQGVDN